MIFTTCYVRDLPSVKRLYDSLKKHEPTADFIAVLIDDEQNIPTGFTTNFKILPIQEMEVIVFDELASRYDWNELKNNCKPFIFSSLLKNNEQVVYVDPTTVFHKSPAIFNETLNKNNAFLVPQLLFAHQHPKENDALNYGIYHNGVMGFNRSEITDKWMAWWQNHTRYKGFYDPCVGMNTDRLCLEFAPVFFGKTLVLKHPGVNVGTWNEVERQDWLKGNKKNELISTNYSDLSQTKLVKTRPAFGIPLPEYSFAQRTISPLLRSSIQQIDSFFNRYYVRIQH